MFVHDGVGEEVICGRVSKRLFAIKGEVGIRAVYGAVFRVKGWDGGKRGGLTGDEGGRR